MKQQGKFQEKLVHLGNLYSHKVYSATKSFPREEIFGLTSQFRRSALSVVLNSIEGYARRRKQVMKNFFEIAYGSLKESEYLIQFSYEEKYLKSEEYSDLSKLADEIGAMLWGVLRVMDEDDK